MREHPTRQELEHYRERLLSPDAFILIDRHVNSCPDCHGEWHEPLRLKRDYEEFRSALEPEPDEAPYHLSAKEARGYVESRLGDIDLEIAESHLELCAACRDEVRRMREAATRPAGVGASGRPRGALWPAWAGSRWVAAAVVGAACIAGLSALVLLWPKTADRQGTAARVQNVSGDEYAPAATPTAAGTQGSRQQQPATAGPGASTEAPRQGGELASNESTNAPPLTETPPAAALSLNDAGREVKVDERGRLSGLEMLPGSLQREVGAALKGRALRRPESLDELDQKPGTLLSESDDGLPFRLSSPVGKVIQTTRPTFRWQPLAGAGSYTVTVVDARLNVVASSGPLKATEWRAPRPLKEGATYSWQVAALKDGRTVVSPAMPAAQAKFRVLGGPLREQLRRARLSYGGSHLALGLLYVRAGLLDEAEAEFGALLRANPGSRAAKRLLLDVRAMKRGR